MKKLALNLDEIDVSSFVADEYEEARGTVEANEAATKYVSCVHICGTVVPGREDDCTSGCVCCRFRPAPKPQI